ncbi:SDR family NAD(P)-dependent oxidoreductase [Alphaproteobacteria bacterium]|nr:SDR family NAD(P)-dependent oxidoreductase [Alphaproteobacteria bacterium]
MIYSFLITGTSSGLGYELARNLLLNKHKVIGISRTLGKSKEFKKNNNFKFYKYDLSNINGIPQLVKNIITEDNNINTLINNSSKFSLSPDKKISDDKLIKIFNTNVLGTIILTRNMMKNNPNLKKIFNILSVSGLNSKINQAIYSSSKHALKGYFDSLMQENIDKKLIINFYPGGMKTELWNNKKLDSKKISKFMDPKNVAKFILYHLTLPKDIYLKEATFFPKNDWN